MNHKKCLVLLGSYNGEKYLREQLDSILSQRDMDVSVRVFDDCSTDGTAALLEEYCAAHPNVSFSVNETNKNFTYNFLDLVFSASEEFDYYALADQDDVWLPEKLIRAAEALERLPRTTDRGALYCSNLIVADENLRRIGMQEGKSIQRANKTTFPYENIATGCTIVFDRKFLLHAKRYYPQGIRLHDYWLFLIAAFSADYVYDENGYILYRQHGNNQIGTNRRELTAKNIRRTYANRGAQRRLVGEFLTGYGDLLSEEDRRRLIVVRDYKKKFSYRMKILFTGRRKTLKRTLILKIKTLFGIL